MRVRLDRPREEPNMKNPFSIRVSCLAVVIAAASLVAPSVARADCGTELQCGQACCPLDKAGEAVCCGTNGDICPGGVACQDTSNDSSSCAMQGAAESSGSAWWFGGLVGLGLAAATRKRLRG
jgi:MYXO-CTERM domain-containing protein